MSALPSRSRPVVAIVGATVLLFSALSFWAIGFVSCVWLGFPMGLGAVGVWIGLSLGTAIYAGLLMRRFLVLTARHYLPAPG